MIASTHQICRISWTATHKATTLPRITKAACHSLDSGELIFSSDIIDATHSWISAADVPALWVSAVRSSKSDGTG